MQLRDCRLASVKQSGSTDNWQLTIESTWKPSKPVTAPTPAASFAQPTSARKCKLAGWVHSYRDHGGLVFIDLRDRDGLTQLVFDADSVRQGNVTTRRRKLRSEWVISVDRQGRRPRGRRMTIPKLPTGEIEVRVDDDGSAEHLAHAAVHAARDRDGERGAAAAISLSRPPPRRDAADAAHALSRDEDHARLPRRPGFLGNRNAVPHQEHARRRARLSSCRRACMPGSFYALPQSPQLFKQLLMVGRLRQVHADRPLFPRRRPAVPIGRPSSRSSTWR